MKVDLPESLTAAAGSVTYDASCHYMDGEGFTRRGVAWHDVESKGWWCPHLAQQQLQPLLTQPLLLLFLQVLHLSSVIAPNQDITFAVCITWTALQLVCSSFFVPFSQVRGRHVVHPLISKDADLHQSGRSCQLKQAG